MTAKCQFAGHDEGSREDTYNHGTFFLSSWDRTKTHRDNFFMISQERHCVVDVVIPGPGGGALAPDRVSRS